ncbi:methionine aminopeptidase 1D, mitochondrial isoform X2 [Phlebotomus papatasi]|uniref:methionine aminopeptidase 1D, mitochondrial isoform X2 n=1 Tax=Phlebotomus papatasi TaxID=29031 RepID=UPI0024833018|nr:methionine aminopeptidase 1D, mitochondrial isoform X2 [Phlebotomus papatasi]
MRKFIAFLARNPGQMGQIPRRQLFSFAKNPVFPGKVSPERVIPSHINVPLYYKTPQMPSSTLGEVEIKSEEVIARMRDSCKLAANILKDCGGIVQVGRTTDDIDEFVHEAVVRANAYPSPLRYGGFPKSVCTSVNNVACHGIPDDRALEDGDIINVDITVYHQGHHGDCSKTFLVGNVDELGQELVKVAEECLRKGIEACGPNKRFSGIGRAIESHAREHKFTVIPAFIGHGIGSYFHGPPEVLHFKNSEGGFMKPGMVFTVEPVISMGGPEVEILEDNWTAVSVDGARSAQFEHTIVITDSGYEILTLPD